MNRRRFLFNLAASAVGAVIAGRGYAQIAPAAGGSPVQGDLIIDEASASHLIPANFTGLSYESAQLSDADFFAASNQELIAYFRLLSPSGVLRLGGNTSESCWFVADQSTAPPSLRVPVGPAADNWMPQRLFAISPGAIDRLGEFLEAADWQLIYGLNLGNSSPERAAREAEYVTKMIGRRLLFFQIGNEPNYYREANNRTRPPNWGFDDYVREWSAFAEAVIDRVPGVKLGGPDLDGGSPWIDRFAAAVPAKLRSHLVCLTTHYYAEGPPDNPKVTAARLLRGDVKVARCAKAIAEEADKLGIECRMTEGNSCYRGGKPGVSDGFASALWAGDYMLSLAAAGFGGVNFHGGGGGYLRAALGGHMPGDSVAKKPAADRETYYTPIAGYVGKGFRAQPIFYGMMLANQLAGGRVVNATLQAGDVNATAYAAKMRKGLRAALFNKSDSGDLRVRIRTAGLYGNAAVWRLTAAALDDSSGVTLAGSGIDARAGWGPGRVEMLKSEGRGFVLELARGSAAVVFLG